MYFYIFYILLLTFLLTLEVSKSEFSRVLDDNIWKHYSWCCLPIETLVLYGFWNASGKTTLKMVQVETMMAQDLTLFVCKIFNIFYIFLFSLRYLNTIFLKISLKTNSLCLFWKYYIVFRNTTKVSFSFSVFSIITLQKMLTY